MDIELNQVRKFLRNMKITLSLMILRKFFVLLLSLVNFQAELVPNRTLAA